jgi:hypothetical protein
MDTIEQQRTRPGWITSFGAFVAILLAGLSFAQQSGEQKEAQRRSDLSEARFEARIEALPAEIKSDMRREIDLACACCRSGVHDGVR